MAYKTVLASFQDAERAPQLIAFATNLAADHGAHLIGLYVVPTVQAASIYAPAPVQISTEILEAQRKHFRAVATKIEETFVDTAKKAGIIYEWRCINADSPLIADAVVEHARSADLVLVGQPEPDNRWEAWAAIPEEVLMRSGRPVMVVPYAGEHQAKPQQILLAWNGTRESARAAFDAMPLLRGAQSVKVLSVDIDRNDGMEGFTPGDDIAVNLARHEVKAETGRSITAGISIGDELLSRAADYGSDLLVMGGYGHSKVYESLFGGATRHILKHMTMPVLMSH